MTQAGWIDVSTPIENGMITWPGDPPTVIGRAADFERGDQFRVSVISMGAHAGTHVDAPLHFLPNGTSIDSLPPAALIGPARILEFEGAGDVGAGELARHSIRAGECILFKTRRPAAGAGCLSAEAARHLTAAGVAAVGVDQLSIGGPDTHRILLTAGVWVIEGLQLAGAAPGPCELICLPLRLAGAEGAPARAILRQTA